MVEWLVVRKASPLVKLMEKKEDLRSELQMAEKRDLLWEMMSVEMKAVTMAPKRAKSMASLKE
jgi:hypothetical protein